MTRDQLLAAFKGAIDPPRPSAPYRLGLLLVFLMMILLPLVYLGLVGGVVWALVYHATHHAGMVKGRSGVVVFLGPLVAGGILVVFMIKPILARSHAAAKPVTLKPASEPLVFALVEKLCAIVRAPMPRAIEVDCQVNASASLRGLFWGGLRLTIGLPLVAGLPLRNFVGVLAHEFGHFAQGAGMRLSHAITSIHFWFVRAVYERDSWDRTIVGLSRSLDLRLGFVFYLARFFIWLTRRILWVLMMASLGIRMFLSRQMEYDADRYEIGVAGSEAFRETAHAMPDLGLARASALETVRDLWREKRLGDDLPRLVLDHHSRVPEDLRREFLARVLAGKGSLLDTHPPDGRRIERAVAAGARGIFEIDAPATAIFADFAGLSRRATLAFYREELGPRVSEKNLVRTEEVVLRQETQRADRAAIEAYFLGCVDGRHPLFPSDAAGTREELEAVREEAKRLAPAGKTALASLLEEETRLFELARLETAAKAGFTFKAEDFGFKGSLTRARPPIVARCEELRRELAPVQERLERRFGLALGLATDPEAARLRSTLSAMRPVFPEILNLLRSYGSASPLFEALQADEPPEAVVREFQAAVGRWRAALKSIHEKFEAVPHPLESTTLAQYAIGKLPRPDDLGGVIERIEALSDRALGLYAGLTARLVRIAADAETRLGLPGL